MAKTYTRPLAEVYQLLEVTQQATGDHLAACIVGPEYDLYRFGKEEDVYGETFHAATAAQDVDIKYSEDPLYDYAVDTDSVKLYADELMVAYHDGKGNNLNSHWSLLSSDTTNQSLIWEAGTTGAYIYDYSTSTLDGFFDKIPEVGDTVLVPTYNSGTVKAVSEWDKRTITGYVYGMSSASYYAAVGDGSSSISSVSPSDPTTITGATEQNVTADTIYTVRCISTGASNAVAGSVWEVVSSNGADVYSTITISTLPNTKKAKISVGSDNLSVVLTFAGTTTTVGTYITVIYNVAQINPNKIVGVTVDSPITSIPSTATSFALELCQEHSGYIAATSGSTTNWYLNNSTAPTAIHVNSGYKLKLVGAEKTSPILNDFGTLYPEFRVLVKADSDEDVIDITSVADIQEQLGTIDIDNDIAYGAYCALKGSAGRAIYALRTAGTDADSFSAAMKKTEDNSELYSFVPLTSDPDVAEVVVEFNAEMSEPDVKMWRRTLIGVDNPGEFVVAEVDNNKHALWATVSNGVLSISDSNSINLKEISFEGTYTSITNGDIVKFSDGTEYTVKSAGETTAVVISSTTTTPTHATGAVKFYKPASVASTTLYVGAVANKYATRRATVVFCDGGTITDDDVVVTVPNKYLAAELAGIASAVVPQQSITHTVVQSITKATKMYTQYTNKTLDEIASQGVLIITQDTKNTDCYIRHQLTTEMDKGNLYYEESCTRNLDNISYAMADIVNGYIGKANVTTSALRALKIDITAKLTEFTQDTTSDLVGPSLVEWSDLEVYQDPTFKDRIIVTVKLYLPLPLNNIKMYEAAFVATVSI